MLDNENLPDVLPLESTAADIITILSLTQQLMEAGFLPGAPPHVRRETLAIDAQADCPRCGGAMDFLPFRRGDSYRAVGLCPACLEEVEL
jgi:hypothetical protein